MRESYRQLILSNRVESLSIADSSITLYGMNIDEKQKFVTETIKKITGLMNIACSIEIKEEPAKTPAVLVVSLQTSDYAQTLIGKNGQNLKSLEHVIKLMTWRAFPEQPTNVLLDVNDYRRTKATQAIELAKTAVTRVRNTQKAEALLPMSAHERRMVHMELASYPDIATESIGEDPQRRIVVKPFP